MKYLRLSTALFLLAATPAFAQQGYYNEDTPAPAAAAAPDAGPASHNVVVTSITKCYAQLGHAEAMDIETHFAQPYQECQRRLALKVKQQHDVKPGQQKTVTPAAAPANPQDSVSVPTPERAQIVPGPPDNPPRTQPPLSDEGLYYRVQKNALPPPPVEDAAPPAKN